MDELALRGSEMTGEVSLVPQKGKDEPELLLLPTNWKPSEGGQ